MTMVEVYDITDYTNTSLDACSHCGKSACEISECDVCNGKTFSFKTVLESAFGSLIRNLSASGSTANQKLPKMIDCPHCCTTHAVGECREGTHRTGSPRNRRKDQQQNGRGRQRKWWLPPHQK